MKNKNKRTTTVLTYETSIEKIRSINSSFDAGILRIAYPGQNRNQSFISKEAFEESTKTIFNCPVVCNYIRETDSIGSHDIEFVDTDDGVKMVHITQPVGVVPESSVPFWQEVEEEDGTVVEYYCAEVLLWKRQEAYSHIKENKITSQSMEIKVLRGDFINGIFHIHEFEFLAFCLLESAEPCFESAQLEVFSFNNFSNEYREMIEDFKTSFSMVDTSSEVIDINNKIFSKGGGKNLNLSELLKKYGLEEADVNFSIEGLSEEEVILKLEEIQKEKFSLTASQILDEIVDALESQTYEHPNYGTLIKYWYIDRDDSTSELYCWDVQDWKRYGFKFSFSEDKVIIDFESKKRKKIQYVDFEEGDFESDFSKVIDYFESKITDASDKKVSEITSEYEAAKTQISTLTESLNSLKEYSDEREKQAREALEKELFDKFKKLESDEDFKALKENSSKYSIDELEEKCLIIVGKKTMGKDFSVNTSQPIRIPIDSKNSNNKDEEPYGGLFNKFPPKK